VGLNLPQARKPLQAGGEAGNAERLVHGRLVGRTTAEPEGSQLWGCSGRLPPCTPGCCAGCPAAPSVPRRQRPAPLPKFARIVAHLQHANLKLARVHAVVGLDEGVACSRHSQAMQQISQGSLAELLLPGSLQTRERACEPQATQRRDVSSAAAAARQRQQLQRARTQVVDAVLLQALQRAVVKVQVVGVAARQAGRGE